MRVLFLNPSGQLGGAEVSLLDMLESLRNCSPAWRLKVISCQEGPFVERLRALQIECEVRPLPPRLSSLGEAGLIGSGSVLGLARMVATAPTLAGPTIDFVSSLRRSINRFAPDLIHTNGLKMHILGIWAKPAGVPLLWHAHDFVGERPLMRHLCAMHSRFCQGAIAVSHSVADDLRKVCGDRMKVYQMYNVVNTRRFTPVGPRLDLDKVSGRNPALEGTIRVGLLGAFAKWKGHEIFLRALARLTGENVRGYIIGDAIYQTKNSQHSRGTLEQIARELGLSERVAFTGFVKDTPSALRGLDIVVHASTRPEPLGMVIIEAMACGRPVVISRAGGAQEIVNEGVDGMTVLPGDVEGMADAIATLTRDAALRERLGAAGRRNVESRFHSGGLAGKLQLIYADSMQNARPSLN